MLPGSVFFSHCTTKRSAHTVGIIIMLAIIISINYSKMLKYRISNNNAYMSNNSSFGCYVSDQVDVVVKVSRKLIRNADGCAPCVANKLSF